MCRRRLPVTVGTVGWVPEHNLACWALPRPSPFNPPCQARPLSVLSSAPPPSPYLILPPPFLFFFFPNDTFASDEEKHYAWMKRGRGKAAAAAVGEIIHIAEDKCIFSTRLIPCTHFQAPCTPTSFYIPRSSCIISSSSPSPPLPPFLAISAATCATWQRQNDGGLFHTVWNTPDATFFFFFSYSGLRQWLARSHSARRDTSPRLHFRLCLNPTRWRAQF